MLCLLSVLCSGAKRPTRAPDKSLPTPHHQFFTRIETTAHQLNATSDYPPYKRFMSVHYDYSSRRARIDYEPVPHMPPKLSLIHISEPTRPERISYAVFCLKKKN